MNITLHSVADRGVPNRERVVLQVTAPCNPASYGLLTGTSTPQGNALPFPDNFFWLGSGEVLWNDWIFVFTGHGEARVDQGPHGRMFNLYMRRPMTVFHNPSVMPILIEIADFVTIPSPPVPPALPQYPPPTPPAATSVPNLLSSLLSPSPTTPKK